VNGGKIQRSSSGRTALTNREIQTTVFHRWVQKLFRNAREPMNLINKEQIPRLEIHQ
jgi:hypothetical protein